MGFMTKNQAVQAFRGIDALSKRAVPTLGSILKYAALKTWLTPAVTEAESISTIAQSSAVKSEQLDEHGQVVIKDIAGFNKMLMDAMEQDSGLVDKGVRITKDDLPRLPEWSDDEKKQEKYYAARSALANEVALLGPLFDHEEKKSDA